MRAPLAWFLGGTTEFLLVALLALSPLPNGSLLEGPGDACWQTILDAGLFLLLLLMLLESSLANRPLRMPCVWLPFALLIGYLGFQLVPLPISVLAALSPTAAQFVAAATDGAATWAPVSLYPQLTLLELLRLGGYLCALIVVLGRFRSMRDGYRLAVWIMVIAIGMAVVAFVQRATASPFTLLWTWELSRWGSPFGPYINKNHFAGLMEIGMAASLAVFIGNASTILDDTRGMSLGARLSILCGRHAHRVVLPFLGLVVVVVGLVLSESRGGWLGMFIAVGLALGWAAFIKRSRAAWLVGVPMLLVALCVLFALGPDRLQGLITEEGRVVNRPRIWNDTLTMTRDFPVFGTGAGTFIYSFQPYHSFPDKRLATHAESDWLQALSGLGLVGVCLLGWAGLRFLRRMRRGLVDELTPDRLFVVGALTGVMALVLHGLVDVNLQIPANGLHFTVLVGLCLVAVRAQDARGRLVVIDGVTPAEEPEDREETR